jgi:hypothetical protein
MKSAPERKIIRSDPFYLCTPRLSYYPAAAILYINSNLLQSHLTFYLNGAKEVMDINLLR